MGSTEAIPSDALLHELDANGFAVAPDIFIPDELAAIAGKIEQADPSKDTFRKSAGLFAIRQFLKELPETRAMVFNPRLKQLISRLSGDSFFVVKSIYFDKPAASNWYVSYHQDLTISVDRKATVPGYGPWTLKQNQFAVQPPLPVLENIFTLRIHLDDTDERNGALKVVPGSHRHGILRPEQIDWSAEEEHSCSVPRGGVMIMKPLLLHSSGRTVNNRPRRVLHIEFSNMELPAGLNWAERLDIV
ncbi:phytanoyl-CoA dioxygenase family protein [Niabella beijingensis]|uniref:phytanoyl-CoA dioxygenase family protein n=1 Tax=Niabella beijingensis TaxID=2872700 RepID=UPI001CBFCB87|nr:phytanoyl-CoA dioxygenase family protein [Niabella beijingensis]MBZ4189230.1 phytanoyl-CoA dioxygenase family protein [Niabella beijingensis]